MDTGVGRPTDATLYFSTCEEFHICHTVEVEPHAKTLDVQGFFRPAEGIQILQESDVQEACRQ